MPTPTAPLCFSRFGVRLLVFLCAVLFGLAAPARAQIHAISPPDLARHGSFGTTVSIDGERALIGATSEDACGTNSGAAYIFERNASATWERVARLVPSTCQPGAFFGRSLSLSGDRALVGASTEFFAMEKPDVAYVFERDASGAWREVAQLAVDPDQAEGSFATSVALDGDRALITTGGSPSGTPQSGAAYIFERDPETGRWHQAARLTVDLDASDSIFGGSGALDGDRAVVTASTYFAHRPGTIHIFERDPAGTWAEAARFGGINDFFISVDIDEDRVLVGEARAGPNEEGRATLYTRDASGRWHRAAALRPAAPYEHGAFGSAVSLDGNRALVAGYGEQLGLDFNIDRVIYVFARDPRTGAWQQEQIIDIGEVDFGTAVDHDGSLALIGYVPPSRTGGAYVVRLH